MTRDAWLEAHPYLRPIAEVAAEVERAAAGIETADARIPDWENYRRDFLAGVSLLSSEAAAVDVEPAGRMADALLERLVSAPMEPGASSPMEPGVFRLRDWQSPGMSRYLSWTATARYLRPVVNAFEAWRDEDRWLRRHCPTCGALPAMAQLVGADPGRKRLLSCGCCGTRWQFKRTRCPFCDTDAARLTSLTIEGEHGLRIDHCESCLGYLKTYDGQGSESLLLSDWSSLHLDLIAHDRGLKRLAASLYDLEPLSAPVR